MKAREIKLNNVLIGGDNKIAVQSMLSCNTLNHDEVIDQIDRLTNAGCDIIRLAVENEQAVEACKHYIQYAKVPLVADIHFNHTLAVLCADAGFSKLRINPGNIGSTDNLRQVVDACKANGTVIRIGVNGGSLEKVLKDSMGVCADSLAKSALSWVEKIEQMGFNDLVISIKSSDVKTTIAANRIVSKACDYPLHIGVTESGSGESAIIKSAIGIGSLLCDGVGDTIRISLTADPVEEVKIAHKILNALGLRKCIEVISCPTCSRCKYSLEAITQELNDYCATITAKKRIKLAVMGCAVNGPGEAGDADFGVAGSGDGRAVLFKAGKVIDVINQSDIVPNLKRMIEEFNH